MSVPEMHKQGAPSKISFAIVIVSDSRYTQFINGELIDDATTPLIKDLIYKNGFTVHSTHYIPDERSEITKKLIQLLSSNVNVILFSGGTGLAKRDVTVETLEPLFEKKIPGFGELLRNLSYEKISSAAMLTRSTAGILKDKIIFCLPGSPDAVKLALEKLILPECGHILKHLK
ncbi:MAG: molybdenum cofactor biosynthesis protein MoaB [Candidatus Odinarchaeum yellowstonii]|uniref:Molybdenum cofactor biosynthesis protein MoaB n=1 Tax=Odinarchaeota yellowstonii (strain LCB_4) TaxID=1841599 RepID=A0AAF0IBN9_ODILC|nr:MAG: molybdenum cofactor biosynthesis protein MoaB [Candidatus Odinarchaeum yellowstonii]